MRVTIVHQNRHRMPSYLLSHQRHEEEAHSRKRSVRGRSQTGRILRQPCRYYLKGTCSRSPCEYWHPPESQCCKTESVRQCLFPDHKVDEQPNQKPKKRDHSPKKKRKRRQGCCSFCENCTTVGLCLARVRAIRTSEKREVSGKPEANSFGNKSTSTIHTVCATSSKYPKKKGSSRGKIQVKKSSSLKSLRFEIWGQVPWRDQKTTAMCPKQGLELCQTHIQAQRERQSYLLRACGKVGTPGCVNKRARGKRVCGRCRSEYAYGQQATPWLFWVGDREDIEESDDGDDGQRRGATMRSHGNCLRIGLIRDGDASWRNSRSSFTREALRRSWVFLPLDQLSKTTSHPNGKTINGSIANYAPFVVPGLSTSSPPLHLHLLLQHLHRTENPATERSEIIWVRKYEENRRVDQQKPKTQVKMKTTKNYEVSCCKMCRNGCRISKNPGG